MGWCSVLAVVVFGAGSPPTESGSDLHSVEPPSANQPAPTMLAQITFGRIRGGISGRGNLGNSSGTDDENDEGHGPSITFPSNNHNHDPGQGSHGPTITLPIPTRPNYTNPSHNPGYKFTPKPNYPSRLNSPTRPNYPTRPNVIPPRPITNSVPSNVVPTQPQVSVEPETNILPTNPQPNNFLDNLGIKAITPQQLKAFQDQITKKNHQLADDLKKLFPGNDQAIDELVNSANSGSLDAQAVQRLIAILGGKLNLQLQLQATGFFKQLIFNNLALKALLNVNFNLLNINNININLVNVNVGGGRPWGGFWGFPRWPWNSPVWLGPGVWWGPCANCNYPYYNPRLNGAAVLGIPYSTVTPVSNFYGDLLTGGILLMNTGDSTVNYTFDGQQFTMEPDYQQVVPRNRLTIAFDRGGRFGQAKYGIDAGWYQFAATDRGWELFKHSAEITLDNDNPFPFAYVLNNQRQTLQPGYRQQHTGVYPLELKFDNGKGSTTRKILAKGDFKVAVDTNGGLELFRPEDVTTPAPIAEMSKKAHESTPNIFAEPEKIPDLFGNTAANATLTNSSAPIAPPTPSLFGTDS